MMKKMNLVYLVWVYIHYILINNHFAIFVKDDEDLLLSNCLKNLKYILILYFKSSTALSLYFIKL